MAAFVNDERPGIFGDCSCLYSAHLCLSTCYRNSSAATLLLDFCYTLPDSVHYILIQLTLSMALSLLTTTAVQQRVQELMACFNFSIRQTLIILTVVIVDAAIEFCAL